MIAHYEKRRHETRCAAERQRIEIAFVDELCIVSGTYEEGIDSGKLDAHLSVRFAETAGKEPSIDVAGSLALRDLRLSVPEDTAPADFARIDLDLASLDPLAGMVQVSSLRVTQASTATADGKCQLPRRRTST